MTGADNYASTNRYLDGVVGIGHTTLVLADRCVSHLLPLYFLFFLT